jgi:hypothetical protein
MESLTLSIASLIVDKFLEKSERAEVCPSDGGGS